MEREIDFADMAPFKERLMKRSIAINSYEYVNNDVFVLIRTVLFEKNSGRAKKMYETTYPWLTYTHGAPFRVNNNNNEIQIDEIIEITELLNNQK